MGGWEVENKRKCYEKCSHLDVVKPDSITINSATWRVLRALLVQKADKEWQALLTGTIDEGKVYVTGYYITEQEVTGATVTHIDHITAERIAELGVVAGIHSHVNMGVQPSVTDIDDSVMGSLIKYHIIINNREEVNAMCRKELPCGGLAVAKCEVFVEGLEDLKNVVIEGIERIKEKTYTSYYQNDGYPESTKPRLLDHFGRTYRHKKEEDARFDAEVAEQLRANGGYGY